MAYDPEARQTSNMALVVGVIVLVLVVGGAIAYMVSRPNPAETAPPTIIHNQAPTPPSQIVPVPVPSDNQAPNVTINPPGSNSSTSTTTTIEKREMVPSTDKADKKDDSGSIDTSKPKDQDEPKSSDSGKSSTSSSTTTTTSPSGY